MMNRIRYKLISNYFPIQEVEEPLNWLEDEKELIRSKTHAGIVKNISNSLDFHGIGRELVLSAYEIASIKADVKVEREIRDDNTDEWIIDYYGWLDFSTISYDEKKVSLKVYENKFFKKIESRYKDKIELDRLTDLAGNPIEPLVYDEMLFDGRDINLISEFKQEAAILRSSQLYNTRFYWMPLDLFFKSNNLIQNFLFSKNETTNILETSSSLMDANTNPDFRINPTLGKMFYFPVINPGSIKFVFSGTISVSVVPFPNFLTSIKLGKYRVNEDNELDFIEDVYFFFSISEGQTASFDFDETVETDTVVGDCFSFYITAKSVSDNIDATINFSNLKLEINEKINNQRTPLKCLTVDKAFSRLFHIITGKQNTYFSGLFSSGFWKDLVLTNGFQLRQFIDKPVTISLQELLEGVKAIDDVEWIIENENVFIEKKSFVFRNELIQMGLISNVEREIISDEFYSKIEIGYDFNGEYENVVGLDEYNIKNEYILPIDTQENEFKAISKVLADSYGMTLAQLLPVLASNPKLDTKYDKNNYFIDTSTRIAQQGFLPVFKRQVRLWQTDFENEPTGVFSPQTAFNLRLSPFNNLLRKSRSFSGGLQKFPNERIIYASTEGNSELVTVYPERANEQVSIFERPYYLPEIIKGTIELSFEKYLFVIKNRYKLFKFVDRNGFEIFGFIKNVKPNGQTAEIELYGTN